MLKFNEGQQVTSLWLSNTDDSPLHAQVRIFRWKQIDFADQLTPSRQLIASPPIIEIAANSRQLIRIIRVDKVDEPAEIAYRLSINELPSTSPQKNKLHFILQYSVPVFVSNITMDTTEAKLLWTLKRQASDIFLEVSNLGTNHAQLSGLTYINQKGMRNEINLGLVGYVLPGSVMRWKLPISLNNLTSRGIVEVTVNGKPLLQAI